MKKIHVASIVLAFSLSACGGSSSSTSTPATPNNPQSTATAEGFWSGTTNTGRSISGLVLDDGTTWFIYTSAINNQLIAGAIEGNGVSNNGSFTSTNSVDFNLEGAGVRMATVSASYTSKQTLTGTVSYPSAGNLTFTSTYDASYETTPNLALLVGNYSGVSAVKAGTEAGVASVDANGNFQSTGTSGCKSSGTISPHKKGNVYNLTLQYGPSPCATPGGTVTGVVFYQATTSQLFGLAINATRDNGLIFLGKKI